MFYRKTSLSLPNTEIKWKVKSANNVDDSTLDQISRRQRIKNFRTLFRQALWRVIKQQKLNSPNLIIYEEDSMDQGSADESGDEFSGEQGTPLKLIPIPFVEDVNLTNVQYMSMLRELKIDVQNQDPVLIDKVYQVLTCNQQKQLRSSNLFTFLMVI